MIMSFSMQDVMFEAVTLLSLFCGLFLLFQLFSHLLPQGVLQVLCHDTRPHSLCYESWILGIVSSKGYQSLSEASVSNHVLQFDFSDVTDVLIEPEVYDSRSLEVHELFLAQFSVLECNLKRSLLLHLF